MYSINTGESPNMQKIKILLIEDDEDAAIMICEYLEAGGFDMTTVFTVSDGLSHLNNSTFDLLILDLNLPDFDGYEVLRNIKDRIAVPVIVVSAYNDTNAKLTAFRYGACDYMVKPINLEELEARIWVHTGRSRNVNIVAKNKIFEIRDDTVVFKGKKLDLTSTEYGILSILVKHIDTTISREKLVASVSSVSSHRSLDNHIKNIRKKIDDNGNRPKYLKTEYGVGYKLVEN